MELFRTQQYYIFVKGEHSLWWDRVTGELIPKTGWDLASADDPECLGICQGIVGKVEHPVVFDPRLMIIKECVPVGNVHGENIIYKIKSIAFLQLGYEDIDLNLQPCHKHRSVDLNAKNRTNNSIFDIQKNQAFSKTWGALKSAGNTVKNTTQQAASLASNQVKSTIRKRDGNKDKERFERRIIEEFYKIFTDTDSFYFCLTTDITNSLQRLYKLERDNKLDRNAIWKSVDDRFFWNKYMLQELILKDDPLCDPWILPIIQGFVQIEHCNIEVGVDFYNAEPSESHVEQFTLSIISRRSRFRAGTRYKRRGVDEDGYCANYVETEQIVCYHHHEISFVQVRGSVPVFWSQPGYKYRPPPRIDKGECETKFAFEKHFESELRTYGPICIVNLVDQTGKEKVIWDAYTNHILLYNNPNLIYATFDFHEYCRGMHFENVSVLITSMADVIRDVNYCWIDKQGLICSQIGVFRINCIDCLDRTNVVQTAIGKAVMEMQFSKLGLISPDDMMPDSIRQVFQLLWANNGDIISKQYAGTNALKGDYTRTGERKFTGIMKDGMNSANRYYLSRFKDAYRQGTIDIMLGNPTSEDVFNENNRAQFEEDNLATAEHVKLLIEDSKKMLINDPDQVLGSWGLIDADPNTGDVNETEMDSIVILTRDSYYVAEYDDQVDRVTKYQCIALKDLLLIECGLPETSLSLFKNPSKTKQHYCIRLNYKVNGTDGYYHMFRSTNLRFFNNMAVQIKNEEEEIESLKAICEAFLVAVDLCGLPSVSFKLGQRLDRRKSKIVSATGGGNSIYLDITGLPHLTRNVSETQLLAIKSAGSKALSNVTEQFSKLNRFGQNLNAKSKFLAKPKFTIGTKSHVDKSNTSSESDDDYDVSLYQPRTVDEHIISYEQSDIDRQQLQSLHHHHHHHHHLQHDDGNIISDSFLPGVGIVMGAPNDTNIPTCNILENKENNNITLVNETTAHLDNVRLNSVTQSVTIQGNNEIIATAAATAAAAAAAASASASGSVSATTTTSSSSTTTINIDQHRCLTPEIRVSESKVLPPNTLKLDRKLSHSADEMDIGGDALNASNVIISSGGGGGGGGSATTTNTTTTSTSTADFVQDMILSVDNKFTIKQRSSSEQDIVMNLSTSQSESALKHLRTGFNTLTSPVTSVTKDLVLSPFSKFAKGMQNLGANLDPRKISKPGGTTINTGKSITERELDEHRKLQEQWKHCKTKLIAL